MGSWLGGGGDSPVHGLLILLLSRFIASSDATKAHYCPPQYEGNVLLFFFCYLLTVGKRLFGALQPPSGLDLGGVTQNLFKYLKI